ncbi:hypothetical protein ACF09J_24000 [Streptomyces sp. NPDC014889]|uniref:hypothetical protein n=1 Tax=Streptomyces sp. NPDC014889 TaxID=3364928 RepID=UPI0037029E1A
MTTDSAEVVSVFPGQGRPGQRIGDLIAWSAPPVLVVVPAVLVRAGLVGDGLCLLAMFSLLLGAAAVYCVNGCWHARLHAGGLLSARTLTGRRTVDLTRLEKVGRLEIAGRGTTADLLVLTDVHGTRIVVDKLAGGEGTPDAAVREALEKHSGPPVLVSGRAAERLRVAAGRRGGRIRPGRSRSNALAAFLPLLLALVGVPVSLGLLLVSLALGGVL